MSAAPLRHAVGPFPDPAARPRMAAGAVFRDGDGGILLVKPTYKAGWDIPGGMVEPGESPASACAREVAEELGLRGRPGRLLVVDWAPIAWAQAHVETDKVLWVFDGGVLPASLPGVRLDHRELSEAAWVRPEEVVLHAPARLARRLALAVRALEEGRTVYAEHGGEVGPARVSA